MSTKSKLPHHFFKFIKPSSMRYRHIFLVQRLTLLITVFSIFLLSACSQDDLKEQLQSSTKSKLGDPELFGYVKMHSTSTLEPASVAWVDLGLRGLQEIKNYYELGDDLNSKSNEDSAQPSNDQNQKIVLKSCPIKVSPETKLDCSLQGQRLLIQADPEFTTNTLYQFALDLGIFKKVPTDYLIWSQKVNPRDFKVVLNPLTPVNDQTFELSGNILTSQTTRFQEIQSILTLPSSLQPNLKWADSSSSARSFQFSITQIPISQYPSLLKLTFKAQGFDRQEDHHELVELPAIGQFKLLDYRWVQGSNPYIQLSFSQILEPTQNLDGLIRIQGLKKIEKRGALIKIFGVNPNNNTDQLNISASVQASSGKILDKNTVVKLKKLYQKPEIHFTKQGNIMPTRKAKAKLYLQAQGLKSFRLKIYKVSSQNINQHFQINDYSSDAQIYRTGELVLDQDIELNSLTLADNHYQLNIDSLVSNSRGSLLSFEASFLPSHINYQCADSTFIKEYTPPAEGVESSFWDYSNYGSWWQNNQNPCHPAYYSNAHKSHKTVIHSDLAIIAKSANLESLHINVRDILTAQSLSDVFVRIKNFQGKVIQELKTNSEGTAIFETKEKVFLIEVQKGDDLNWLKLDQGASLSISKFNISGSQSLDGLQVYQYGERGVWRPGDTLYLTSILYDKNNEIPSAMGIQMKLKNPQGNTIQNAVIRESLNGFYHWTVATNSSDPTGSYTWETHIGSKVFSKKLKIAKVKPNRLKVKIDFHDPMGRNVERAIYEKTDVIIQAQYLHGATAKNLKTQLYLTTNAVSTQIPKASDFQFDDIIRSYIPDKRLIATGALDGTGKMVHSMNIKKTGKEPGQIQANIEASVLENGGQSTRFIQRIIHPFDHYVGIKTPKGDQARGMLLTDKDHTIDIITRTPEGKIAPVKNVKMSFYKLNWKWWWTKDDENRANYLSANGARLLKEESVSLKQGNGKWTIRVNEPDWGRYLIRACDPVGQHCTSKVVFIDWPGWAGRAQSSNSGGPQILPFATDKQKYNIGETVKLTIPSSAPGFFWVSLENGSRILKQFWKKADPGSNEIEFTLPEGSSPNAYVSVVLVQPSDLKNNDLPLRLYGVVPIDITDPSTLLVPVIQTPEVFKPNQKANVEVSEKSGKSMTYTLALVDEGLLDLTNFATPDAHKEFYKRQTLGVRTWDLYDEVMGAYGGNLDYLLAIGGGGTNRAKQSAKRFQAMVKFAGPFHLKPGASAKHSFELPSYVGSVRVMVVAGDRRKHNFGSSEVAVPVRQDIMVQATLPRVLGPGEKVQVPLQIFNMSKKSQKIDWKIHPSDDFKSLKQSFGQVNLKPQTDTIILVPFQVAQVIKKIQVRFEATAPGTVSREEIEIDIKTPVSLERHSETVLLKPGESHRFQSKIPGYAGHQHVTMTASSSQALNIDHRLKYLMSYPHGCVEQTTSKAFPQLYLNDLVDLNPSEATRVQEHINAAILKLLSYRNLQGLMSYWPGQSRTSEWGTIYVAHFLTEARKKGYQVDSKSYNNLIRLVKQAASMWVRPNTQSFSSYSYRAQAYRLYVLSLANATPHSALNRFYETPNLDDEYKWYLAAAYFNKGSRERANKILAQINPDFKTSGTYDPNSFGGQLRDQSILLDLMASMGLHEKAFLLGEEISRTLSSSEYLSTHETAWALKAVSNWKLSTSKNSDIHLSAKGLKSKTYKTPKLLISEKVELKDSQYDFTLKNEGKNPLYIQLLKEYHPKLGEETVTQSKLTLTEKFKTLDGKTLNPSQSMHGDDIILEVQVKNQTGTNLKQLVMTKVIPTGWEFSGIESTEQIFREGDYSDIRDDRVYYYFELNKGQTRTFKIPLKASYAGEFYHSGASVEHMYQNNLQSRTPGDWVKVKQSLK